MRCPDEACLSCHSSLLQVASPPHRSDWTNVAALPVPRPLTTVDLSWAQEASGNKGEGAKAVCRAMQGCKEQEGRRSARCCA